MVSELDTLASWCQKYGGTVSRPSNNTVRCDFDKGTFVKMTKDATKSGGKANVSMDGRPEMIIGSAAAREENGLTTIIVNGMVLEPRDTAPGATVLQATEMQHRSTSSLFDDLF